jgi:ATP-dependent helicase/nuclease subunit B
MPPAGRVRGRPRVRLLTLEQSALLRCELVILAGATASQIPGPPAGEPFFNQSVRGELGLTALPQRQALGLARLRRVLEAAPEVRISYAPEQVGEPAQLCPWIEAVESLAQSGGLDLRDHSLAARAGSPAVEIAAAAATAAPRRMRPAPPAPAELLPEAISATAHQTLIDCPYRYFAAACLGLAAEQAPDQDPDRSDYGQRVHRILEGFVRPLRGLPAPFPGPVTAANRAEAESKLAELAEAVFAPDLHSRALAHVWLTEFSAAIPALAEWLSRRGGGAVSAEVKYSRSFGPRHSLIGKADRVETLPDGALGVRGGIRRSRAAPALRLAG